MSKKTSGVVLQVNAENEKEEEDVAEEFLERLSDIEMAMSQSIICPMPFKNKERVMLVGEERESDVGGGGERE